MSVLKTDTPDSTQNGVLLYIHGGGFVFGTAETHKHLAADIARQLGMMAVLPNYRLAPENPFPAGLDDVINCYNALLSSGHQANEIVVGGDSAGGNLVFALMCALIENQTELPACIFALSPVVDLSDRSGSMMTNAKSDCVLPLNRFDEMNDLYAQGQDIKHPKISPLYANLTNILPVLIQVSKHEILYDQACAMATKLAKQGTSVQLDQYDNGFHVFQMLRGMTPEADAAVTKIVEFVKQNRSKT